MTSIMTHMICKNVYLVVLFWKNGTEIENIFWDFAAFKINHNETNEKQQQKPCENVL